MTLPPFAPELDLGVAASVVRANVSQAIASMRALVEAAKVAAVYGVQDDYGDANVGRHLEEEAVSAMDWLEDLFLYADQIEADIAGVRRRSRIADDEAFELEREGRADG